MYSLFAKLLSLKRAVKVLGEKVVSSSYDSTVKLWDINTGKAQQTLVGHASAIWALDCLNGQIVSGSTDTHIRSKLSYILI